ncbi:hypothetical protein V495_00327 [Pseudogymnoascus sp. VKM F-4514 (FW-929)]|nr:hypothetical protein V495_00327 [Pseudogymnoascus sp. VKM F-4514 (FW-929)]
MSPATGIANTGEDAYGDNFLRGRTRIRRLHTNCMASQVDGTLTLAQRNFLKSASVALRPVVSANGRRSKCVWHGMEQLCGIWQERKIAVVIFLRYIDMPQERSQPRPDPLLSKTGTFASYYLLWAFIALSLAFPADLASSVHAADSNILPPNPFSKSVETRDPIANGTPLRVLCLGASIMGGQLSRGKNGMRYALRSALAAHGNKVDMIGSVSLGTMDDNKVEAWPGYRIEQVAKKADLSLSKLPNVVAILAGTNDAGQGFDTPNMANRMATLIDHIFAVATGTTIIVGALPPMYEPADDIVRQYNRDLADLVSKRSAAGQKIFLADMHSQWWSLADLTKDKVHPTDAGYLKMARVFYDAIIAASNSITPAKTAPSKVGSKPTTSDKASGSIIGPNQTSHKLPLGAIALSASAVATHPASSLALSSESGSSQPTTVTTHPALSSESGSSQPTTVTTHPALSSESGSSQPTTVTTHPALSSESGSSHPTTVTTHPALSSALSSESGSSQPTTVTTHPALSSESGSSQPTTVTTHPALSSESGSSQPTTVTTHPALSSESGSSHPITVTTHPALSSESGSLYDAIIAANNSITPAKTAPSKVGSKPTTSDKASGSIIGPNQTSHKLPLGAIALSSASAVTTHPVSSSESGSSHPTTVTTDPALSSETSACQESLNGCLTSLGTNFTTSLASPTVSQGSTGVTEPTVAETYSTSSSPSAATNNTVIFTGAASFEKPVASLLALSALAFFF